MQILRDASYRQTRPHRWKGEVSWNVCNVDGGFGVAEQKFVARSEDRLVRKMQKFMGCILAQASMEQRTERSLMDVRPDHPTIDLLEHS